MVACMPWMPAAQNSAATVESTDANTMHHGDDLKNQNSVFKGMSE